jgi:hypothetical protein
VWHCEHLVLKTLAPFFSFPSFAMVEICIVVGGALAVFNGVEWVGWSVWPWRGSARGKILLEERGRRRRLRRPDVHFRTF